MEGRRSRCAGREKQELCFGHGDEAAPAFPAEFKGTHPSVQQDSSSWNASQLCLDGTNKGKLGNRIQWISWIFLKVQNPRVSLF